MGDPLLSIHLLFLSPGLNFPPACSLLSLSLPLSVSLSPTPHPTLTVLSAFIVSVSPFFFTTLTQGQVGSCEHQPPFTCQTCFCLPFCPCIFRPTYRLLRLQIGGCKMTNVKGTALGVLWRGKSRDIPPVPLAKRLNLYCRLAASLLGFIFLALHSHVGFEADTFIY